MLDRGFNDIKGGVNLILHGLEELQNDILQLNTKVNYLENRNYKNEDFFNQLENLLQERKQ